jgi:hypothetical protein
MLSLYNMNVTQASLFPDLDGLARSMAYEAEFHWALDVRTLKRYWGYETFEYLDDRNVSTTYPPLTAEEIDDCEAERAEAPPPRRVSIKPSRRNRRKAK